jgi:hypothetical protein
VCVQLPVLSANILPHLGSCSFVELWVLHLTGRYKSSTNVEIDSDILNTIASHRLVIYCCQRFTAFPWLITLVSRLLSLVCCRGSTREREGVVGLSGYADLLGKGHLNYVGDGDGH